jgi:hypothetical protein
MSEKVTLIGEKALGTVVQCKKGIGAFCHGCMLVCRADCFSAGWRIAIANALNKLYG